MKHPNKTLTALALAAAAVAALTACDPGLGEQAAATSSAVAGSTALTPLAADVIAVLPAGTSRESATYALTHDRPFRFTAHTPDGEECWTWLIMPNGATWAIGGSSDRRPYVPQYAQRGNYPGLQLSDWPRDEWRSVLACDSPRPTWVSVPPTPASEIPRSGSGLRPGDPLPTRTPSA